MKGRLLLCKMQFEMISALRFACALPLLFTLSSRGGGSELQPLTQAGEWLAVLGNLLLQAFLPGLLSLLLYYRGLSGTKVFYATFLGGALFSGGRTAH
ncbi:hypothetical protein O9H85_18195 [Paenibacillus filicis]|uniref:Uncharacterized protein n=1 Tax=Paenibacillus gyeongsangnamensis TaxID=3388067 RepID=A0ABT4QBQ6_9BACL|nr:hypothetical protein [Paenibacillus filicis]MCZ8514322.1 hypothetical protein [Paenibacillus filicis]